MRAVTALDDGLDGSGAAARARRVAVEGRHGAGGAAAGLVGAAPSGADRVAQVVRLADRAFPVRIALQLARRVVDLL